MRKFIILLSLFLGGCALVRPIPVTPEIQACRDICAKGMDECIISTEEPMECNEDYRQCFRDCM